jgi:type IV secretory pathway TrbD component
MWVIEFGTINGTAGDRRRPVGRRRGRRRRRQHLRRLRHDGGAPRSAPCSSGFIANALILVGLSQFWLQAIYGLVILVAVSADALILRRIQRATAERRAR